MSDFFADRLLNELDQKPALEALEEAILESRKAGFDYVDDEEALNHFLSESQEVVDAFRDEGPQAAISEAGDLQLLLVELVRRRGGSLPRQTRETARKFLRRLQFVESALRERGQTWADVKWPDDVQPIWNEAKKSGL